MEKRRINEKNNSFNRDLKALMRVYDVRLEDIADEIGINRHDVYAWLSNELNAGQRGEICDAIHYQRKEPDYGRPHSLERVLMQFFDISREELAQEIGLSLTGFVYWMEHPALSAEKEKMLDNGLLKIVLRRLDAGILKPQNAELKGKMRAAILHQRNGSSYKRPHSIERALMCYFDITERELARKAGFSRGAFRNWIDRPPLDNEKLFENALLDIILRRLDTRR